jgi:hypothetical protein
VNNTRIEVSLAFPRGSRTRAGRIRGDLPRIQGIHSERYAICSLGRLVRPARDQSALAVVAHRMREHQVEPRSIVLFFALLSAFIAILTLRAHLLAPANSSAVAAAQAAPQTSLTAKVSSLRTGL